MSAHTCLCGLPVPYPACCGKLHRGEAATTAEQLMRSRFTAFGVGDETYLLRTWHPSSRPPHIGLDKRVRWVRLEVLETTGGTVVHTEGTVRFRAHYVDRGKPGEMEENSKFVRVEGQWMYAGMA
ncbi:SEC-C motif-containing protein [Nonomuraea solani]|uniref:SEC-C motif-containing protein n=1 Tax=Nonomuraea solani TaxID=1144553 RepID=A0A1H6EUC3_9ACTN|nr:YchJ family metal-binding protein [Nonomuraea solani]SEH00701.1 SEC-C motif-containing protein [Nonomuraea solani]